MGESVDSLFRRGAISEKQMRRMGGAAPGPKGTRAQPSKMANFDDKGGRRDQGGGKDRGAVGRAAIDERQDMGSPERASGKMSKGASVNASGQPRAHEIDAPENQRPEFPSGGRVAAKNGRRQVGVKGPAGKSSGPLYGGPSSRVDG